MTQLQRCNSVSGIELYLEGVHPDNQVTVTGSCGYYYVYKGLLTTPEIPKGEYIIYEGEVKGFSIYI